MGLDPAVTAFAAASGATDLVGIDALVKYVRAQGLFNNFRLYPMKSAQNAGSGSTVYGLGGLTTNDMTLVNSPTWGASGIEFDGVNQYGSINDFLDSSTLTAWARWKFNSLAQAGANVVLSQNEFTTNKRSWALSARNDLTDDPLTLARSSDGTAVNTEVYREVTSSYSTSERMYVAQWIDGGGRQLWLDKASQTLALEAGTALSTRYDADIAILVAAQAPNAPGGFSDAVSGAVVFLTDAITTTQREAITDLINAL